MLQQHWREILMHKCAQQILRKIPPKNWRQTVRHRCPPTCAPNSATKLARAPLLAIAAKYPKVEKTQTCAHNSVTELAFFHFRRFSRTQLGPYTLVTGRTPQCSRTVETSALQEVSWDQSWIQNEPFLHHKPPFHPHISVQHL